MLSFVRFITLLTFRLPEFLVSMGLDSLLLLLNSYMPQYIFYSTFVNNVKFKNSDCRSNSTKHKSLNGTKDF